MTLLASLNILLAGIWAGMYLFTTFVVSPAFARLPWTPDERRAARSLVGRQYARVNAVLSLLLLASIAARGLVGGWHLALTAQALLWLLILALVAYHVRRGVRNPQQATGWITSVTLACTALMCAAALG